MTKEALKLALEALVMNNAEWKHLADSGDSGYWSAEDQNHYKQTEQAITAVQRVLANEALEKMAENARELGLDYEPEQTEQHQDWCASLTQMLMSMPPKPAPCNCKPKPEQPKVRTGNCLRVGVCASEGHKIAPQRTWVGLTDKDWNRSKHNYDFQKGVDWAESILKEKNT